MIIHFPFFAVSGSKYTVALNGKALFGTRVFMEISEDNPHKIQNPYLYLKAYLVLEYWVNLIPTFSQILVYFS